MSLRTFLTAPIAIGALASSACSVIGAADVDKCTSNTECRASFGLGSTCGGDGLCSTAPVAPRCTQTFPDDLFSRRDKYKDSIVIGSLMDRSSATHASRERSSRLAVKQVNEEGGVDGHTFGVVYCTYEANSKFDDLKAPEAALASAHYLAESLGVPAILGPAGSGDVSAVYRALAGQGTLVMSPSATSPALTELDPEVATDAAPGLLWRTAPPDTLQGPVIAADMTARSISQVFLISQKGAYGDGLATVFQKSGAFKGELTLRVFGTENERTALVTEAGASPASEVLFISSTQADVIAFLNAAAQNPAYDTKTLFLTDSAANKEVIDGSPPALYARIRGSRPTPVNPADAVFANFSGSYASEYSEDVTAFSFTAHMYDATWLVLYGAASSLFSRGEVTGLGIAQGLRKVSSGKAFDVQPLSWGGILETLRTGAGVNVRGASGELDYDPATEETSAPIQVWTIGASADGGFEVIPAL
jgi:ABC-type branched-subunit amino acid transport system substrate-binding protein